MWVFAQLQDTLFENDAELCSLDTTKYEQDIKPLSVSAWHHTGASGWD